MVNTAYHLIPPARNLIQSLTLSPLSPRLRRQRSDQQSHGMDRRRHQSSQPSPIPNLPPDYPQHHSQSSRAAPSNAASGLKSSGSMATAGRTRIAENVLQRNPVDNLGSGYGYDYGNGDDDEREWSMTGGWIKLSLSIFLRIDSEA